MTHVHGMDWQPRRGFLPIDDPLPRLPPAFDAWEEAARRLPKLLLSDRLREELASLPPFPDEPLETERERERAMQLLSFLAHAYVWGGPEPAERLPARLAVPWTGVASALGRPPVLAYASYTLNNWHRLDPEGPVAIGNLALNQNVYGGTDEDWFGITHLEIEARAVPAIQALEPAQAAAERDDPHALASHLHTIATALDAMGETLRRMPEGCDPYVYYHRIRPYVHGWKDNPALPDGLVYEGVNAFGGRPQRFRGGTGAQSALFQAFDAALGVQHERDSLHAYLLEMRDYMPPAHRAFVERLEAGPSVRDSVRSNGHPALLEAYNGCLQRIEAFRQAHLKYAAVYVSKQARQAGDGAAGLGTGGTPFMASLKRYREETGAHRL